MAFNLLYPLLFLSFSAACRFYPLYPLLFSFFSPPPRPTIIFILLCCMWVLTSSPHYYFHPSLLHIAFIYSFTLPLFSSFSAAYGFYPPLPCHYFHPSLLHVGFKPFTHYYFHSSLLQMMAFILLPTPIILILLCFMWVLTSSPH